MRQAFFELFQYISTYPRASGENDLQRIELVFVERFALAEFCHHDGRDEEPIDLHSTLDDNDIVQFSHIGAAPKSKAYLVLVNDPTGVFRMEIGV